MFYLHFSTFSIEPMKHLMTVWELVHTAKPVSSEYPSEVLPISPFIFQCTLPVISTVALLKAQICTIYFQTCTQIFGIHKALIHLRRYKLIFLLAVCSCKSQYMYEYITETGTPLSELKTFLLCKET